MSKIATAILQIIKDEPTITYNLLSEKLSLGRRTVQRHIQKLKADGLLNRIGSERSGHWEIVE
ncbi:MAG: winged helix-turn-helix domain-containing protein [Deltaproteobacteria bacterium]|nr:winged helix-turn-helix domain-containing protein [Deltaproteobacteria bacterium]